MTTLLAPERERERAAGRGMKRGRKREREKEADVASEDISNTVMHLYLDGALAFDFFSGHRVPCLVQSYPVSSHPSFVPPFLPSLP
jgi:hypothetical protein